MRVRIFDIDYEQALLMKEDGESFLSLALTPQHGEYVAADRDGQLYLKFNGSAPHTIKWRWNGYGERTRYFLFYSTQRDSRIVCIFQIKDDEWTEAENSNNYIPYEVLKVIDPNMATLLLSPNRLIRERVLKR